MYGIVPRDCHRFINLCGLQVRVGAGENPHPQAQVTGLSRVHDLPKKKLKNRLKTFTNIKIFLINVIVTHLSFKMSPKTLNLVKI